MRELTYLRPDDAAAAVTAVRDNPRAQFLGGGTNLVDHLKLGVSRSDVLVDISRLPLDTVDQVAGPDRSDGSAATDGGATTVRIGANVRNSDLAAHPLLRSSFPAVSRALLAGASGQIRNQATTGGNLLQRTRCVYFQDTTTPCNKREPGSGCSALEGYGRYNAILGTSESCVATHPSDLAVALAALDATVLVLGPEGERRVPLTELHRLPGHHPDRDTHLARDEMVIGVELTASDLSRASTYEKVRDRASYAFALVSVAAALELDGDTVTDVRIAWGGVAHKPWRATVAEDALRGQAFSEEAVLAAAEEELRAAVTSEENAYKTAMVRNTTAHALGRLAQGGQR